jgi:hypothetical protein
MKGIKREGRGGERKKGEERREGKGGPPNFLPVVAPLAISNIKIIASMELTRIHFDSYH